MMNMALVVRNDSTGVLRISGAGNERVINPGQVITLTEDEYENVPFDKRGFGKILAISPEEASSETLRNLLDWYIPPVGSTVEIRYQGMAPQGSLESDPVWIIKRFSHDLFFTDVKINDIQVLSNVAWDDRNTLPWT
jgi:hypothetical protein